MVVRFLTASLGVALCVLPATASAADAAQKPGQARRTTSTVKKKHAYSATASRARRARLAHARASARVREQVRLRGLQEAMTPQFKTDATASIVPDVRAAAAIIFDPVTGQVLYEENSQDKRSIASITKVMTALVYLEDNPDLNARSHRRAQRRVRRVDDLSQGERPASPRASCCTCCSSRPTTAPRARSRAPRTAARRRSSSG